jgi:RNA polymerase sigma-70 factor (ECF subfamily)
MHTPYEALVREHRPALERLARKLANNHRDDAEDLLQESLLDAYRSFERFRPGSQFFNWFARIMTNNQLDRIRRTREHVLSLEGCSDEEGTGPIEIPDERHNPEQLLLRDEFDAPLKRALERLEPNQRITVQLCDLEGKTYEEAAAATRVPIGTIRSRLHRAHKALERSLPQSERRAPSRRAGSGTGVAAAERVSVACSRQVAPVLENDARLSPEPLGVDPQALRSVRGLVVSREDEARLRPEQVTTIAERVRFEGMGLVVLHGGDSPLLRALLGPDFGWTSEVAPEETGMVEVRAPRHPIAEGVGDFRLPRPVRGGVLRGPKPDQVIFAAKDLAGSVAWQGMAWNVGRGRVFCFVPGCEVPEAGHPVGRILRNAARWCAGQH